MYILMCITHKQNEHHAKLATLYVLIFIFTVIKLYLARGEPTETSENKLEAEHESMNIKYTSEKMFESGCFHL